jgi:hypothetical protein
MLTELVKAFMLSTYLLKSLRLLFLMYTYTAGERVHGVDVLPVELAPVGCKVYLLSW